MYFLAFSFCLQFQVMFCKEEGLLLMADEVYQTNTWQAKQRPFISFKKVLRDLGKVAEGTELISFHSVSKGYEFSFTISAETFCLVVAARFDHLFFSFSASIPRRFFLMSLAFFLRLFCSSPAHSSIHHPPPSFVGECGRRGGFFEMVNIDPEVAAQIYKSASISLCSNVEGQLMVGLMCNPPKAGDASYAQLRCRRYLFFLHHFSAFPSPLSLSLFLIPRLSFSLLLRSLARQIRRHQRPDTLPSATACSRRCSGARRSWRPRWGSCRASRARRSTARSTSSRRLRCRPRRSPRPPRSRSSRTSCALSIFFSGGKVALMIQQQCLTEFLVTISRFLVTFSRFYPSHRYCLECLAATGIVIVPGSGFGQAPGTHHFRTTILPSEAKLDGVMQRFKTFHLAFMKKYE